MRVNCIKYLPETQAVSTSSAGVDSTDDNNNDTYTSTSTQATATPEQMEIISTGNNPNGAQPWSFSSPQSIPSMHMCKYSSIFFLFFALYEA